MINAKTHRGAILSFTLPTLVVFSVVVFYPLLQTLFRSLCDWNGLFKIKFIGLKNFANLFGEDLFYRSLVNGLWFAGVLVLVQIGLGSLLAFKISELREKRQRFFIVTYFLPVVLSVVVVCQLWVSILEPESGLINQIFKVLGLPFRQHWLTNPKTTIFATAFVNAWQFWGYEFLILLTSIKAIPSDYLDAARIDGAGVWRVRWHIQLPLLSEAYKIVFTMAIAGGLSAFSQMYIMTSGGPGTASYTLTYMMIRSSFYIGEYGYACAAGVVLVAQCLLATILINRFLNKNDGAL